MGFHKRKFLYCAIETHNHFVKNPPPKFPSVQAMAWPEEGVGGRNPATPEQNQKEAAPAALLVRAEHHRKVLFSF